MSSVVDDLRGPNLVVLEENRYIFIEDICDEYVRNSNVEFTFK
jgi:hypothetical protein